MDKRVIFAVAGSGKTTLLIRRLREDRRTLILTFTVNNEAHLRAQIIRRFGYIPYGIRVMTWFEFLHGFCFRPFLQEQLSSRGLSFNQPLPEYRARISGIIRIPPDGCITGGSHTC